MFTIINFAILSFGTNYENIYNQENIVKNTCDFNTIRFKREKVACFDRGQNQMYCNDNNLANEFVVTKELGVGNKEIITIKPTAYFEEIDEKRYKIADFYYNFYCDERDNQPYLRVNIVPTANYDISFAERFFGLVVLICFVILVLLFISMTCPSALESNHRSNYSDGLLMGVLASNMSRPKNRRRYCE